MLRMPESLLIEGYRLWLTGIETDDPHHWGEAWTLCSTIVGSSKGRLLLDAICAFTRTLKRCSQCPLRIHEAGTGSLCSQELLIIGLISGIQYGDETMVKLVLEQLSCPLKKADVLVSAEVLAVTLSTLGVKLAPACMECVRLNIAGPRGSGLLN